MANDRALGILLLGWSYGRTGQFEKAIANYQTGLTNFRSIDNETLGSITCAYIGDAYSNLNQSDSAIHYCKLAVSFTNRAIWAVPFVALHLGNVYTNIGEPKEALKFYHQAKKTAGTIEAYWGIEATKGIASVYKKTHQLDSALFYGFDTRHLAQQFGFYGNIIDANLFLSEFYRNTDAQKALVFSEIASSYKDSLSRMERLMAIEDFVSIDETTRQQELETTKREYESQLKLNALLGSSFTLLVVAFVLFRSQRQKQKAKKKIEEAYSQLKATQSQLIQSEKMASLGELTAGIAHEIQNPLNFVNNFSEVNKELIQEIQDIRRKTQDQSGKSEEDKLLNDIAKNQEKILHHGKRADAIVKGMLQHSRSSSGQKELTDINALCDEYLRLSYHGLRAKDKSFNAKFDTDFDSSLPKLNVVPQDIVRVVLNLINNAFFAVNERLRQAQPDSGYEPTVTVTTKKISDKIEIRVKDNGNGIPDTIKEKIFQPFFTTKPTGQGTGLGLSLSYDIVKAHGGELRVETKEARPDDPVGRGEGSEFIILLPLL